jgi:hypothetical protein
MLTFHFESISSSLRTDVLNHHHFPLHQLYYIFIKITSLFGKNPELSGKETTSTERGPDTSVAGSKSV